MNNGNFKYIDSSSILVLVLIMLIAIGLISFFFILKGIGYIIGSIFIVFMVKSVNHVVLFKGKFLIIRYLIIFQWIPLEDVRILKCELTGMGRSRDILIYLYYDDRGKIRKSIFLHFRFLGYKKIVYLLNNMKQSIEIESDSFKMVGIRKIGEVYSNLEGRE